QAAVWEVGMRVKIFSPYPDKITPFMKEDEIVDTNADFIVSFGHDRIFTPSFVSMFPNRIINIHISILPWNRGADPNFWSWFDRTKKGVTIHYIDHDVDTGDVLFQDHIDKFRDPKLTLATTYAELMERAVKLFASSWPSIRRGSAHPIKQGEGGRAHKKSD